MSTSNSGWVIPVLISAYLIFAVSCVPRRYKAKPKRISPEKFWEIVKRWGISPNFHAEGDYEVPWGPLGKIRGPFQMDATQDSMVLIIGTSWDTLRIALGRNASNNKSEFLALQILNTLLLGQRYSMHIQSIKEVGNQFAVKAKYDTFAFALKMDKDGRPLQVSVPGERLDLQYDQGKFPAKLIYRWERGRIVLYVKNFEERR